MDRYPRGRSVVKLLPKVQSAVDSIAGREGRGRGGICAGRGDVLWHEVPLEKISCKLLSRRSTKVKAPSLVTILSRPPKLGATLVILFMRGGFTLAAADNRHHCSPSLGNGVDFTLFSLALIMVARIQGTGLRALWFIAVCSVLFASVVSGNRGSHHHHALPARRHAQPGLGHHWKRQANSTLLHGNSTLTEAELIFKAAQEEAAKRNKYIVEHVRRNRYSFGNSLGAPNSSTADSPATGINQTVAAAAAIAAESICRVRQRDNSGQAPDQLLLDGQHGPERHLPLCFGRVPSLAQRQRLRRCRRWLDR